MEADAGGVWGNRPHLGSQSSQKWIDDLQTAELLAMLQVLRVEDRATGFAGCADDQRVIPLKIVGRVQPQRLFVESQGGVNLEQRTKDAREVLLAVLEVHAAFETFQGEVEELLNHLVAHGAFVSGERLADQFGCNAGFGRIVVGRGVDEDVRVQKESIAHSSLPA